MLSPQILFDLYALIELFSAEVEKAKKAESEGGEAITPQEWLAISIAVGGPALKKFLVPTLPDEAIERAAEAISSSTARVTEARIKAAAVLDRAKEVSGSLMQALQD